MLCGFSLVVWLFDLLIYNCVCIDGYELACLLSFCWLVCLPAFEFVVLLTFG